MLYTNNIVNLHKIRGNVLKVDTLDEWTCGRYYNKAIVITTKEISPNPYYNYYLHRYLLSYNTIVCEAYHGNGDMINGYEVFGIYSRTTQAHIKDFLKRFCNIEIDKSFLERIATDNASYKYDGYDYLTKQQKTLYNKKRIKGIYEELDLMEDIVKLAKI